MFHCPSILLCPFPDKLGVGSSNCYQLICVFFINAGDKGAKMIASAGEGFPETVTALRKVPGIGDYTAGAVASIAFNEVTTFSNSLFDFDIGLDWFIFIIFFNFRLCQ